MTLQERIAIGLVAVSWVICAGVLVVPFLPVANKLLAAALVYFVSQLVFWTGCALAGKEFVRRYRVGLLLRRRFERRNEQERR